MKKAMILFGLVAATLMSCQNAPKLENNTGQRLLGTLEVSFGAENGKARAMFTPLRIAGQALVNEAQLLFTAGTYSAATQTTPSRKFLNAQFSVRNLTGAALNNLTLVAYHKSGNIGNTALKNIVNFGGIGTTSSKLFLATVDSYAQSVRPSQAMSGNGTVAVVAGQEDLALFTDYDVIAMTTTAGTALASGEYLLPYGFTVRDLAAPNAATQRTIPANNSADTGTVTLAMSVDGSNEPTVSGAYRFSLTALVFENPTPRTRVSASLEEKNNTDVATRLANLGGGGTVDAGTVYTSTQNQLVDYAAHVNGNYHNVCQVRIAGPAIAPISFLESVAPTNVIGTLNPCFSSGGFSVIRPNQGTSIQDIARLPDGRIVAVGQFTPATPTSWLGMFTPSGTRLAAVNSNATAATTTSYTSIGLDSLNRIIRAGHSTTGTGTQISIGRSIASASSLTNDTTFSSTETINTQIYTATGSEHVINDLVVQPDNKIVAVGYVKNGTAGNKDVLVIRYNTDGTLDTTFNTTGYRIDDVDGGSLSNEAKAVLLDSNGNIVVVGGHNSTFLMMRLTASGARDTTFNAAGHFYYGLTGSSTSMATALGIQGNQLIVAGEAFIAANSKTQLAILRINANGTLDSTFGTGGEVIFDSGLNKAVFAKKVLVQSDQKILVIGHESNSSLFSTSVTRYLANGATDDTFLPSAIAGQRHHRVYTYVSPDKSIGYSGFITGSSTAGKLVIGGLFRADNIVGNQYGMLSQINLGAN